MKYPINTLDVNILNTGILFECIRYSNVKKVILTSSTTVYGEGLYKCNHCHEMVDPVRNFERYNSWECHCADCGNVIKPLATPEGFVGNPLSFYALSKLTQEKTLRFLEYYKKIVHILRFPIVYGPGQTDKNKYPGAVGTFVKNAIEDKPIEIIEDGYQLRDFLYVEDCVNSIVDVIEKLDTSTTINIATGKKNTLLDVCKEIEKNLNKKIKVKILDTGRIGDSRHNVISTTKAIGHIGFNPKYTLETGIKEMIRRVQL